MFGDTAAIDNRKKGRSRLTNGYELLPSVDGRSTWARLMRDIIAALTAHCGGADNLSETQRMIARRCAALDAEAVCMEDKFARTRTDGGEPKPADLQLYCTLLNAQRRCLEMLGMERGAKDVTGIIEIVQDSFNKGQAA
jgi:hypothetical protein